MVFIEVLYFDDLYWITSFPDKYQTLDYWITTLDMHFVSFCGND